MLVLARKVGQPVHLYVPGWPALTVVPTEMNQFKVRLGFEAHERISIVREELLAQLPRESLPAGELAYPQLHLRPQLGTAVLSVPLPDGAVTLDAAGCRDVARALVKASVALDRAVAERDGK